MTSPRPGDVTADPTCQQPECDRRAVPSATLCRVHLIEPFRREGRPTPFEDLEMQFGHMQLSSPAKYESKILLRWRVGVPARAEQALIPPLQWAVRAMVEDLLGPDVWGDYWVGPVDNTEASGA